MAKEHQAINRVVAGLDEKNRRRFVGVLALQWGRGGIARLIEITGLSRNTICRGLLKSSRQIGPLQGGCAVRAQVAPRLKKTAKDPESPGEVVAGCHSRRHDHWP